MTDSVPELSGRMTSKFAVPARWKYVARHSITNWRFGGLPVTAVKIPSLVSSVRRSSWYGISARSRPLIGKDVQPDEKPPFEVVSWRLPLELTYPLVYESPYTDTGNGKVTGVAQSSQWLPASVTPGTIVWPVCVFVM